MRESVNRIAIFRALQLGDILCAMPAVRAIREFYPDAEILFIGLPHTQGLIERFGDYIDRFIVFPGYPGLPEQPFNEEDFNIFAGQMRGLELDLIFQLQGNGSVVYDFLYGLGAKRVVGFCERVKQQDENLMLYPKGLHEVDRHLALLTYLGIPHSDDDLFFPLFYHDEMAFKALGLELKPKRYICIHPGSRGAWRQWPIGYFAAIADYCKKKGFEVIITGSRSELPIAEKLLDVMKEMPIVLCGRTSLGAVAYLIKNAALLVANCTGVSHVAAALKTPSVIISMDGEPGRWGPKNTELHITVDWTVNPDLELVMREVMRRIDFLMLRSNV